MKQTLGTLLLAMISFTGYAQKSVQSVLNHYKDSAKTYGIAALVSERGVVQTGHIGYAYSGKPMAADQLFGIGSNTKVFIATTVLKLQEQKKLNINDHIGKYIDPKNKYIDTSVTIRQLLNHSSGIKDYASNNFINHYLLYPKEILSDQNTIDQIDTVEFSPGARHEYSNTNFFLLRLIIEKVMDEPIDVALNDMIINPYGLSNTKAYMSKNIPGLAHPTQGGDDLYELSFKTITDQSKGPGQMVSNAADLCKFFDLLFVKKKILSKESLDLMLKFEHGDDDEYGLGIFRSTMYGKKLINHTGKQIGYQSFVYCAEGKNTIFVVLSNDMNEKISYHILKDLVQLYLK